MVQGWRINQLLEAESASTSTLTHCSPQILVVAADLTLLFHHLMLLALASHRVSLQLEIHMHGQKSAQFMEGKGRHTQY
jgi:hypothetical protein